MTDDLFTYAASRRDSGIPAHQSHSPTSKDAAVSIKPRIGPMHAKIIEWLRYSGTFGLTDESMQDLGMAQNTQRPRRRELQQAGLIVDSGKTRQTRSGRQAVVWVLKPQEALL